MRLEWHAILLAGAAWLASSPLSPAAEGVDFFEKNIRPVLVEHCYKCHSAEAKKTRGGLAVDTRAGLRDGGDSGPALVARDPAKSLLLKALRHDGLKMPNDTKRLPDAVIADFETWIKAGAADPRDGTPYVRKGIDYEEGRRHWAYQPVKVTPAVVKDAGWVRNSIDQYILARLEAKGLHPAADAAPHTLLRRLTFAITGLPPAPADVLAFEKAFAANPDAAVAEAVDRLLASPRHGEYWARHWLDGIRYDQLTPTIDHYVDWLIRSFNAGMPYDQFVTWQLAGDLLPPAGNPRDDDDRQIATQMLTLNLGEMDLVEGCVEVTSQQFLGVSINCAKCHDHKFDAYTQADYYALAGIFASTEVAGSKNSKLTKGVPLQSVAGAHVVSLLEGKVADTNLLIRGERNQKGPLIERRFPIVIAGDQQMPLGQLTKGSGRLELARWIVDAKNPLAARVMANRVWMWMTGQALVGTPNDFGAQGERPTHPELLDYLADRLVKSGWSVKALIRDIATSHAYRQASTVAAADPENNLYTRMPLRRLDAEQLADSLAFAADALVYDRPPFGMRQAGRGAPRVDPNNRDAVKFYRGVYGIDQTFGKMFDCADPDLLTIRRDESVTAPQLLYFMNNPTVQRLLTVRKLMPGYVVRRSRTRSFANAVGQCE